MRKRGRGEGTITRRADGRWEGRISLGYAGGRRRRLSIYGRTRGEVASQLTKLAAKHSDGLLVTPDRVTLAVWAARWLEDRSARLAPKTYRTYEGLIRTQVTPRLGGHRLQGLRPVDVQAFFTELAKSGLSPRTQRHVATLLRAMLREAARLELIPRNPAEAVRLEARPREPRATAWSPGEVTRFLAAAQGDRLHALFYLLLSTGLRIGEALGLRWRDLDLDGDGSTLRVAQTIVSLGGRTVVSQPKTARSRRRVYLPVDLVTVLEGHREAQLLEQRRAGKAWQGGGLVFTTTLGRPLNPANVTRTFRKLTALAGVTRIRLHDLRHTYASLALRAGVPVEVLSQRLGHASVEITLDVYRHVYEGEHREAAISLLQLVRESGRARA